MGDHVLPARVRRLAAPNRIAQFVAVGTVGASVDVALLALFHGVLGIPLVPGKLASAEISFLVMFVINERWTFSEFGKQTVEARIRRLVRSNAVRLGGLLTATVVLVAVYRATGVWYLVANVVGIAVGFVVNYSLESLFTWRVHR
jgi:putative flippase GtrA